MACCFEGTDTGACAIIWSISLWTRGACERSRMSPALPNHQRGGGSKRTWEKRELRSRCCTFSPSRAPAAFRKEPPEPSCRRKRRIAGVGASCEEQLRRHYCRNPGRETRPRLAAVCGPDVAARKTWSMGALGMQKAWKVLQLGMYHSAGEVGWYNLHASFNGAK